MNKITKEELKEYSKTVGTSSTTRCNMEFDDFEIQEFLNRHGYELHIKEERITRDVYNSDHDRTGATYQALYKRIVAVPIGTVLPEILPEVKTIDYINDECWNYDLQKTFEKVMRTQMLKL